MCPKAMAHGPLQPTAAPSSGQHPPAAVLLGLDNPTLFVVDALGLIYRSYHALAHVTMSSRILFDTRAVYGFTLVLLSLVADYAFGNPIAVVFEGQKAESELDFRTSRYPQYKAHRPRAPPGIQEAVPWIKRIVRALGLAVLEVDRFEADDVIGTLVQKALSDRIPSVIVSSDKDFRQLLDAEWVQILRPANKSRGGASFEYVTEQMFRNEFSGLSPARYVDVLALMGDKADNIPGVAGIGKKSAPELISTFGTLENLLQSVADPHALPVRGVTPRQANIIRARTDLARLSYSLVEIDTQVSIDGFDWGHLCRRPVDRREVDEVVECLDFDKQSLLHRMYGVGEGHDDDPVTNSQSALEAEFFLVSGDELPTHDEQAPSKRACVAGFATANGFDSNTSEFERKLARRSELPLTPLTPGGYHVISSEEEVINAARVLESDCSFSGAIGIALIAPESGKHLTGLAVSAAPGAVYLFDMCKLNQRLPPAVAALFRDECIEKRGWGLKEVWKQLYVSYGVQLQGCLFDIRIASDLVHAGRNISNQSIVRRYLGEDWASNEPPRGARDIPFWTPHDAEAGLRCSEMAYLLPEKIKIDLESTGASRVAYEIEFLLVPVLARMELAGVPFNRVSLWDIHKRAKIQMKAVESEALSLVRDSAQRFNLASREEVSKLLFETWKLPISVKTGTGKPSTGRIQLLKLIDNLEVVESQRKFVKLVLKFREMQKIESTYTRSLVKAVTEDGRIHSTIWQDSSSTGRLSMSNPNLQSIPVRSDLGREVRGAVVAREGFSILCADYSQIELRILAALSGDERMISAFLDNVDIHAYVAARIFGLSNVNHVSSEQRSKAKAMSYGIPYGISAYGLSQQLGVSLTEAKCLISEFYGEFPKIEEFTRTLISAARSKGYAETLCGRRLYLPLLRHGASVERRAAERVAVNMPIQGTQADMIKRAMIGISDRLHDLNADSRMILQVHDELVFEVAHHEHSTVEELIVEMMSHALPLPHDVAVEVKRGTGHSWQEAASRSTLAR